ncbi:glycoside hydrolase family 78 protein [Agromyces atrinae]|uniref:alpha-L-rhamnosidase n=1 Tax=Agromyces atrinae TaxID=592376 RepID=UPI001F5A85CE|nr:alpha-L-rhamnosidase [Agromyces atrinae]MCI2957111.1 glycoside hydrolase family 78 protein [Agromyces atrinae]
MNAPAAPDRVGFEHLGSPAVGIGTAAPRLSWIVPAAPAGWVQRSYRIELTDAAGERHEYTIDSSESVLVAWPAAPLASRDRAVLRVAVSGADGEWSAWSEPAVVEAGLLNTEDWVATGIAAAADDERAPRLGTTFHVDGDVLAARLYITAHGLYRARVNGAPVDQDELAPGWTAYEERLAYQTIDVTDLVHPGRNTIDATLGNGWWRGRVGYEGRRAVYGNDRSLLAQLEVQTSTGTHIIATGDDWRSAPSAILADDLFDGQTTDLTVDVAEPSAPVAASSFDVGTLVAQQGPGIRATELLAPVSISYPRPGVTRLDFGQNLVGRLRLTVAEAHGEEIELRHAEVLEHGELGVRPLRTARATDRFVLPDDGGRHVLEPEFTFHGFRYAEVTGLTDLAAADIRAVVIHTALRRTGWFSSSDPLLDRLHENVVWGMRGNFVGVPTDCPQRDERLGWTGDLQVFSPTAAFLFDSTGFLSGWLDDLAAEQADDGTVPWVVPDILKNPSPPTAAWGDAAVLVPWALYRASGDTEVLRRAFASMRGWVDRVAADTTPAGLWTGGFQFGDWLDPDAPPNDPFAAKTDADLVATACFFRSADVLAQSAALIGETDAATRYAEFAERTRLAFLSEYVTASGRMVSDTVAACSLALVWDIATDDGLRAALGDRLADLVRARDFRVSTGFVGTPLVTDALTLTGHIDVAYRLLLQTENPSWLYSVTMGATTIWERWDSMLPDGTINPGQMTSFNHYAFGAIADWLHRVVAGLAIEDAGYERVLVEPRPTSHLDHAEARLDGPRGLIATGWAREQDGRVRVHAEIPVGSAATVILPDGRRFDVGHGRHDWVSAAPSAPAEPATIADVLDDPELWAAVVDVVVTAGAVADAAALAARLGRHLGAPVADLAIESAPPFKIHIADDLRPGLDAITRLPAQRGR